MKHNLGKLLFHCLILFSLSVGIKAEDFSYAIKASKHEVYLHEPLQLTVDLKQTNPDVVLLFHFTVNESPDYAVKPLLSKYADTLHHVDQHMVYKIYPLKTGDINITFSLIKRETTDDKVRYFASGDRDDFKKLETIDSAVALPSVTLYVKPVPEGTQLVGDFKLSYHVSTHHTSAFSPINMDITLQGKGYPPKLPTLIPKDPHYTLFSEKPSIQTTSQDEHTVVHYLFALSAKSAFTLAPIHIQAFNPYTQTPYTLSIPEQKFTIDKVQSSALLDQMDTPAPLKVDWGWMQTLLRYLLVFFAGYLSATVLKWTKKKTQFTQNPLREKIAHAQTDKALLQLLISQENKDFTEAIERLESSIYGERKVNLATLKKELLEKRL